MSENEMECEGEGGLVGLDGACWIGRRASSERGEATRQ